jgi:isochorismate hydrolase
MRNKSAKELRKVIKSLPEQISLEYFHQLIEEILKVRYVYNQKELLLLLTEMTLEIDDKMKNALLKVGGNGLLKRAEKNIC